MGALNDKTVIGNPPNPAFARQGPALRQLFDNPPRDFGATPLWWWSGAKVTRDRLAWQLRRFADGSVHNLVVGVVGVAAELQADQTVVLTAAATRARIAIAATRARSRSELVASGRPRCLPGTVRGPGETSHL